MLKYNGKELQSDHGLEWYDYGARFYDPQLARWFNVDPLAEKYVSMSSYNYCFNNPINVIDPNGKDCVFTIDYDKNGDISKVKISSTIYITGTGANENRAAELRKTSKEVFRSKEINGVNVSFDIDYQYSKNLSSEQLKEGDNVLEYVPKLSTEDDRSHVDRNEDLRWTVTTSGSYGQIYKEDWDNTNTVFHESMHFLGISDKYSNDSNPFPYFSNDIMGKSGSGNIGPQHYYMWSLAAQAHKVVYPSEKIYLIKFVIDKTAKGKDYRVTKAQQDANPF